MNEQAILGFKASRLEKIINNIKVIIDEDVCPFKELNKNYYHQCGSFCINKKECNRYKKALYDAHLSVINARNSINRVRIP
jgi:hypothetical protein